MGYYSQGYGNIAHMLNTPIKAVQGYLLGKAALKGVAGKNTAKKKQGFEGEPQMTFPEQQEKVNVQEDYEETFTPAVETESTSNDEQMRQFALNTAQQKLELKKSQQEAWKNLRELYKKQKELDKGGVK